MPSEPSAFDRFYNGGEHPNDALDLAIADALHLKQGHASALIRCRDNQRELAKAAHDARQYLLRGVGNPEAIRASLRLALAAVNFNP